MGAKKKNEPTLGERIDSLYALSLRIKAHEAELRAYKQEYDKAEALLMATVGDAELEGARGRTAIATITRRDHLNVAEDGWPKFEAYVYKHKALDLLQKRPSITAWRERVEHGETVPGLQVYVEKTLSLRKSKGGR